MPLKVITSRQAAPLKQKISFQILHKADTYGMPKENRTYHSNIILFLN